MSCFNCTETFHSNVCHIPLKRSGRKWSVTGTFCTLSCAMRFIIDTKITSLSMFHNYVNEVYSLTSVAPAKSRYTLSKFVTPGISIEEFRHNANIAPYPPTAELIMTNLPLSVSNPSSHKECIQLYPSKGIVPLPSLLPTI